MDRPDFAFTCYRDKENEDVELLTTQDPATIETLLARFEVEEEIARDLKGVFHPETQAKYAVILLLKRPSPECTYAYTGVLQYTVEGLASGYIVVFRSRSGDLARIETECEELHTFLTEKLSREKESIA